LWTSADRAARHRAGARTGGVQERGLSAPLPALRTIEEELEYVAAGHGVVILPLSPKICTAPVPRKPLNPLDPRSGAEVRIAAV
jgi:hypothetical protein